MVELATEFSKRKRGSRQIYNRTLYERGLLQDRKDLPEGYLALCGGDAVEEHGTVAGCGIDSFGAAESG